MIKLVAFDWNGTLLSDTAVTLRAENAVLKAIGKEPISLKKFQSTYDIPISIFFKNLGLSGNILKEKINTIKKIYYLAYENNIKKVHTRGGTKEILKFLKQHHIYKVIYSNHYISKINHQLMRLGLNRQFDMILAQRNTYFHKHVFARHKEHLLNRFVKEHKLKPGEVISVGDTEEEIQIGKAYGYRTVALTGGWNTAARLKKQHPDFLIHNMAELKKIVKQLNQ